MTKPQENKEALGVMERFSSMVLAWTGKTSAFILALGMIVIWLAVGPIFRFSDSWQLVINTTTTIVTFLMVFLIQRAQNKDAKATALKLNELIAAMEGASNRLIDLEDLSENDLEVLHQHYRKLVEMAKQDTSLTKSHSIDEATARHRLKLRGASKPA